MSKPTGPILAITLALAAALLAGCGGSVSSPTPAGTTSSSGAQAGSGGPAASVGVIGSPSTPTEPGTGELPTACDLLSESDIQEVLGRTVERAQSGLAMGTYDNGCEWFFADDPSRGHHELVVGAFSPGGQALYERSFLGEVAESGGFEAVSGIGDVALRHASGDYSALRGDTIVHVFLIDDIAGNSEQDAAAQDLLRRALAKAVGETAAPGSSTPPSSGSPDGDACSLLTEAQLEEFVPRPVESVESQGPSGCRWVLDTDSFVPGAHGITVTVTRGGGRAQFDGLSALEPVPGIGDGAVKLGGNTDGTVWAVRDDTLVKLVYNMPLDVTDADPVVLPLLELVINAL